MRYADAKKIKPCDYVWVPDERMNGVVLEVTKDDQSNDLFFRIRLDKAQPSCALYHHTAVQQSKSVGEIVEFFLGDPRTRVYVNHNNELGQWLYSVVVADSNAFWLCSFDTEAEAKEYIREYGLKTI